MHRVLAALLAVVRRALLPDARARTSHAAVRVSMMYTVVSLALQREGGERATARLDFAQGSKGLGAQRIAPAGTGCGTWRCAQACGSAAGSKRGSRCAGLGGKGHDHRSCCGSAAMSDSRAWQGSGFCCGVVRARCARSNAERSAAAEGQECSPLRRVREVETCERAVALEGLGQGSARLTVQLVLPERTGGRARSEMGRVEARGGALRACMCDGRGMRCLPAAQAAHVRRAPGEPGRPGGARERIIYLRLR